MTAKSPAAAAADIASALEAMLSLLAESATLVRNGGRVDLTGLDRETAELIASVKALPGEQARAMLPGLDALLAALSDVEAAVRTAHGSAVGEPAAKRIRAVAAYGRGERGGGR